MSTFSESQEEIKWHNAQELSHIINQYKLERKYVLLISQFLKISEEGDAGMYYKRLDKLQKELSDVAYSSYFLSYLIGLKNKKPAKVAQIKPRFLIDNTPVTHIIHASYFRVLTKTCCYRGDKDRGKPRPDIFIHDHSISGAILSNNIEQINKLYYILKPFGYDFPDVIMESGMMFELCNIRDPIYTDSKGEKTPLIDSISYTSLYKDYVKQQSNKIEAVADS